MCTIYTDLIYSFIESNTSVYNTIYSIIDSRVRFYNRIYTVYVVVIKS